MERIGAFLKWDAELLGIKNLLQKGGTSGRRTFFFLGVQENLSSFLHHACNMFLTVLRLHSTEADV
jgi:hypothetical protein